ncbi:hypothetical protein [uncultured Rubinisphaera sp.]|uniref:hypothetical protein n=1 Tax=uncultured Rubinisphaera sp. TaxID=1678686 RepID=UPI0030DC3F78
MEHTLDTFARRTIRDKACQIANRFRHTGLDRDDLESLLIADLLRRRSRFDEIRSKWTTFVQMVVNHAVADLIALGDNQPKLRGGPHWEINKTPDERTVRHDSPTWHTDLANDLRDVLSELSDEERDLCHQLSQEPNISEAARQLAISRGTAYSRINAIRKRFEKGDLDKYF